MPRRVPAVQLMPNKNTGRSFDYRSIYYKMPKIILVCCVIFFSKFFIKKIQTVLIESYCTIIDIRKGVILKKNKFLKFTKKAFHLIYLNSDRLGINIFKFFFLRSQCVYKSVLLTHVRDSKKTREERFFSSFK